MGFLGSLMNRKKETQVVNVKDSNTVKEALKVLKKGGVIVYPTETSYGLGVDSTNPRAVKKIYEIKFREKEKKMPVIMTEKMIRKHINFTKEVSKLVKKFMPGPLSLVVERKGGSKVFGDGTIMFRISSNKFANKLVEGLGNPITSTSANLSGKDSLYNIYDVMSYFVGKVDLIIDAGNLKETKPSTIFDVENRKVLREGPISENNILKQLK